MKIIITNPGRIYEERPLSWRQETAPAKACVTLTEKRDQTMLGFGAALTDSACIQFNKLDTGVRDELLEEIFSPEKMNFSIARICVGASDYAAVPYHFAPVADDMAMEHFDASHDDTDCIPIIRKAQDLNPDLYIYSSPWSPPGWMKTSGSMYGGWMIDRYVEAYAKYYLKFIQYYASKGIKISAMTPQNEAETDQTSRMPACLWHPDIEARFIKVMRKLLDENGLSDMKIWMMDHNFLMWHRIVHMLKDPELRAAVAGTAWHPYEGHPEMVEWVREQYPEGENHWTEGGMLPSLLGGMIGMMGGGRPRITVANLMQGFNIGINNGIQSITVWNLALDEAGYPNIGPFGCRGTVEISRDGKRVKRSDEYYVMGHFTKYVKRGAKRVVLDCHGVPSHFAVAAFENPNGQIVVQIANTETFDSGMTLRLGDKVVDLWVLRESANTVLL
ncbi:MAG: glycoside hydrolase family 30 protein [Christensenellales bacterium]